MSDKTAPAVPFYPNHEDGNHCMVAVYRSLFEHFLEKPMNWEEMEDFVGYKNGQAAWTLGPLVKMAHLGFDIHMIEPFDYRKYARKGEAYLGEAFGHEKAEWLLAHSNVADIAPQIPSFLRSIRWDNRQANLQDIDDMLTVGRLVFVTLNAQILQGESGYSEHAVLVIGREGGNYIVHDPGPPAQAERRIPRALLWEAMGAEGNTSEVTGFKLRTKAGQRVDQYVTYKMPRLSRAFVQKLCEEGKILVNGQPAKPGHKLRAEDIVDVQFDESTLDVTPNIDLPVIYEDDSCIVINKPAGVLTHAQGAMSTEGTVASFIRSKMPRMEGERAGIVHRLDRATSGVILGAKSQAALSWYQQQFAARKVKKTYMAVVSGYLKRQEAIIDMPIERNPKAPATFRVGANGKPAKTHYKVIQEGDNYSLIELKPETGRTHQLRVHLAHIGHPIVGDPLYGSGKYGDRLYLHALSLEVTLMDHSRRTFTAPLPLEFTEKVR